MSDIRKDGFGQEIKAGDVIAYGSSNRYAGVKVGIVLNFTPKMINTSVGQIDDKNCVVMTEQVKLTRPQWLAEQLEKYKDKISTVIPKSRDRVEYFAGVFIEKDKSFGGKYSGKYYLILTKSINGVETKSDNSRIRIKYCYETQTKENVIQICSLVPHMKKKLNGWSWEKTGLVTNTSYSKNKTESKLTQKMVKELCGGFLPESTTIFEFDSQYKLITHMGSCFILTGKSLHSC